MRTDASVFGRAIRRWSGIAGVAALILAWWAFGAVRPVGESRPPAAPAREPSAGERSPRGVDRGERGGPAAGAPATGEEADAGLTIRGTVVGEDGAGVPAASVTARVPHTPGRGSAGLTDAEGRFELRMDHPCPGRRQADLLVVAGKPGHLPGWTRFTAPPGGEGTEPLVITLRGFGKTLRLSGHVTGATTGVPLEGVRVSVLLGDSTTAGTVSRQDGSFGLDVPQACVERLLLIAEKPGCYRYLGPVPADASPILVALTAIPPDGRQVSELTVHVVREDGSPVPAANVTLAGAGGSPPASGQQEDGASSFLTDLRVATQVEGPCPGDGRADAAGDIRFRPLLTGAWRVVAFAEAAGLGETIVEVSPGGTVATLVLKPTGMVRIVLRGQHRDGEYALHVASGFGPEELRARGADGVFEFRNSGPQALEVEVSEMLELSPLPEVRRDDPDRRLVWRGIIGRIADSHEDCEFTIDIPNRLFLVRGRVLGPEGSPVPGVVLEIDQRPVSSDSAGRFEVDGFSWQPRGVRVVDGVPEGLIAAPCRVPEPKDGVIDVEVRLREHRPRAGTVVRPLREDDGGGGGGR